MNGIGEAVPMKTLSFVNDACELLVQCHKVHRYPTYTLMAVIFPLIAPLQMMIYACIAEFFSPQDGTAYLTFLVDDLDADTTSLQAFLGEHWGRSAAT